MDEATYASATADGKSVQPSLDIEDAELDMTKVINKKELMQRDGKYTILTLTQSVRQKVY